MERIVFLTGHLARASLESVLRSIDPAPFSWTVHDVGVQVAALMTADLIQRRLPAPVAADRILVPGRCRGDLDALSRHYGIPVARGPDELKDLPRYFDRAAKPVDLSRHDTMIFAEIVDAPQLGVAAIVERAAALQRDGADVIDLGCLPATPFPHLAEAVQELKRKGHAVSVDSLDVAELRRGALAGADYLLSLTPETLRLIDEVAAVPIIVPGPLAGDVAAFDRVIETFAAAMRARNRPFLVDTILDPIPFGFAASIARYVRLRERFPDVAILMGVGNLTELVDADTTGINALLLGIAAELRVTAILTTQVSPHARRAVREADAARRMMYAARETQSLPKGLSDRLLTVRGKHPYTDTPAEITATAAAVRDPNFRVQVAVDGVHVYNRAGHQMSADPFALWPKLDLADDGSHAFYMGVELARAQIAWQLGKRYVQDEPLDWGVAVDPPAVDLEAWCAPGTTRTRRG